MEITIDYLRLRLRYDPETGKLFWREASPEHFKLRRTHLAWNTRFAGKEVGAKLNNGYLYLNLKKKVMLVHRVIFAMVHGYWPEQVDHENHVRTDNRLVNLREVNHSGNAQNTSLPSDNTSGRIGVYWFKQRRCWYARIKVGDKNHHLGYFSEKQDAITAREKAEKHFGFHHNHGLPANDNILKQVAA
ncbi:MULTISPECIES: HNH endonuclease signature motif containing protein [unclassified Sinorhizobium]|uniref:HNH endonuclease signature motif containing protein n=1 Tax=unclassified Sinorhizobium TaxID=2613772 RepID=UPI003523BF47